MKFCKQSTSMLVSDVMMCFEWSCVELGVWAILFVIFHPARRSLDRVSVISLVIDMESVLMGDSHMFHDWLILSQAVVSSCSLQFEWH